MAGLLSLFGPATADPMGQLLGSYYDPNAERAAGFSSAMKAISQSLLNPAGPNGERYRGGDFGTIGKAASAAGTGYKEGKVGYLQEAASRKLAADEMRRKQYEEDKKLKEDSDLATWVSGLSPEMQKDAQANPGMYYEYYLKEKYATSAGKGGLTPRASTTVNKVLNPETKKWEDWQVYNDGRPPTKVEYGKGEPAGPGEGTVRGKEFASYDDMVNAANTSIQNIADAGPLIGALQNDPSLKKWGTGLKGVALANLPGTDSAGIRQRVNQLRSLAFFAKLPEMKGYGALSNIEGKTVTDALNRMEQALNYDDFQTALTDYTNTLNRIFERNQKIISTGDWEAMDAMRRENGQSRKFDTTPTKELNWTPEGGFQ